MKKVLTLIIGFIPINIVKIFLLRMLGHSISYKAYIGFSLLSIKNISLDKNTKIKSFNFININDLILKEASFIGRFNIINGPFNMILDQSAGISKRNKIRRSKTPISYGNASFCLGQNSIIVSNHFLDLTKSIIIGDNSIIAGISSQLWTHGYYHADEGPGRARIDGKIEIGNNVYVGSGCIFNPGVKVADAIHIGAGSVISKDLENSGMYVSQALRFVDNNLENIKTKLTSVENKDLVEEVYTKSK